MLAELKKSSTNVQPWRLDIAYMDVGLILIVLSPLYQQIFYRVLKNRGGSCYLEPYFKFLRNLTRFRYMDKIFSCLILDCPTSDVSGVCA